MTQPSRFAAFFWGNFFVARRELCGAALKAGWQTRGMRVYYKSRQDRLHFFEQKSTF
jgi:hypothetical protein